MGDVSGGSRRRKEDGRGKRLRVGIFAGITTVVVVAAGILVFRPGLVGRILPSGGGASQTAQQGEPGQTQGGLAAGAGTGAVSANETPAGADGLAGGDGGGTLSGEGAPQDGAVPTIDMEDPMPDNKVYDIDFSEYELQKDTDGELFRLVDDYCRAKSESDVDLLLSVFGVTSVGDEERAERKAEMDQTRKFVAGYENIACYYLQGPEQGTYIVYPYFEIRYLNASVAVPCLNVAYAKRGGDGTYYLTYNFNDSLAEYVKKANTMEDVRLLSLQIDKRVEEARQQDAYVRKIYQTLKQPPQGISETLDAAPETSEGDAGVETDAPEVGTGEGGGETGPPDGGAVGDGDADTG